ncbi:hypothetical protein M758_UG342500 [Ceratodon purpureus]|nr:hypothetical protein M758_UG342500 [Ceratodon purpureus]
MRAPTIVLSETTVFSDINSTSTACVRVQTSLFAASTVTKVSPSRPQRLTNLSIDAWFWHGNKVNISPNTYRVPYEETQTLTELPNSSSMCRTSWS